MALSIVAVSCICGCDGSGKPADGNSVAPKARELENADSGGQSAEGSIQSLIEELAVDSDREKARERLTQIGTPAIPHLLKALKNPNPVIRTNVVWALGGIPESRGSSLPYLIAALHDTDGRFRSAIVWELGQIGRPVSTLFPLLVEMLDDDNVHVRVNAADALVNLSEERRVAGFELPHDKIVDVLCSALSDDNVWAPCHAAPVLARLGQRSRSAIPVLLKTLHHANLLVRVHAGRALYRLDHRHADEVVQAVVPALEVEGPWTADSAAELLEEIGTPRATASLKDHAER